jgi:hypothetical protein
MLSPAVNLIILVILTYRKMAEITWYIYFLYILFEIYLLCFALGICRKYFESFEIWCWERMEKVSLNDHVKNYEVLLKFKEENNDKIH